MKSRLRYNPRRFQTVVTHWNRSAEVACWKPTEPSTYWTSTWARTVPGKHTVASSVYGPDCMTGTNAVSSSEAVHISVNLLIVV